MLESVFRLIVRSAGAEFALLCGHVNAERFSVLAKFGTDIDVAEFSLTTADATSISALPPEFLFGIAPPDLTAIRLLPLGAGQGIILGWRQAVPSAETLQSLHIEVAAAMRDIAVIEEGRARALEENIAKSRFLASLSHDLRTPLNAIIGFAELVRSDLHGDGISPRYRGYVDDINASGLHLLGLINEILDLSKIAAGKMEQNVEDFGCGEILPLCLKSIERSAGARNILLNAEIPEEGGELRADRRMAKQVLVNLLANAVKLSPDDATVSLRWLQDAEGTIIEIADQGKGMTAQEIGAALTPYTAGADTPRRQGGAGLGLLLAASLARLHGGWLKVVSAPGQGTVRSVFFPSATIASETP